jgi:hypothetical protein
MKNYQIIESTDIKHLENSVQNAIDDKWIPLGNIVIEAYPNFAPKYFQTMYRPNTKKALKEFGINE